MSFLSAQDKFIHTFFQEYVQPKKSSEKGKKKAKKIDKEKVGDVEDKEQSEKSEGRSGSAVDKERNLASEEEEPLLQSGEENGEEKSPKGINEFDKKEN